MTTGTREWSSSSLNIQRGCEYDCKYCYAKAQAVRFGRCAAEDWSTPLPDSRALMRRFGKRKGVIMFPTAHDITGGMNGNHIHCIDVLRAVLSVGNRVLIVTKADRATMRTVRRELAKWIDQIEIRFTIGSLLDADLQFWEPNAPMPTSRLSALTDAAHDGWNTSLSVEPMLVRQAREVFELCDHVLDYVNEIWLGPMNYAKARLALNGHADPYTMARMSELIQNRPAEMHAVWDTYQGSDAVRFKDGFRKMMGAE